MRERIRIFWCVSLNQVQREGSRENEKTKERVRVTGGGRERPEENK